MIKKMIKKIAKKIIKIMNKKINIFSKKSILKKTNNKE